MRCLCREALLVSVSSHTYKHTDHFEHSQTYYSTIARHAAQLEAGRPWQNSPGLNVLMRERKTNPRVICDGKAVIGVCD